MSKYFKRQKPGLKHLTTDKKAIIDLTKKLGISNNPAIGNIIDYLFEGREEQKKDTRSIINPDKFYTYFDNNLTSEGLLFREFIPILERDFSIIKKQLYEWMDEGKISSVIEILKTVDAFYTLDRLHKVTKCWIIIINREIQRDHLIEYWVSDISSHMDRIQIMFGGDKSFFHKIHDINDEAFFFDTYVIRILLRKFINSESVDSESFTWPIKKEDLQQIAIERLRLYITTRNSFDVRAFNYFYYNCWKGKKNDHVLIMDEANEIIKEYIDAFPEDYLRFIIRPKYSPHIDETYVFEPFIPQYFGSWEAFKQFLYIISKTNSEFEIMIKYFLDFEASNFEMFHSEKLPIWLELDENITPQFTYFKHQTREAFLEEYEKRIR